MGVHGYMNAYVNGDLEITDSVRITVSHLSHIHLSQNSRHRSTTGNTFFWPMEIYLALNIFSDTHFTQPFPAMVIP